MEKNNIFEGAKFGDRFATRGGKKGCGEAIYHYYNSSEGRHYLICKGYLGYLSYRSDGTCSLDNKGSFYFDIIKRNEPLINEDELDELADKHIEDTMFCHDGALLQYGKDCFKAGYRKAKEE